MMYESLRNAGAAYDSDDPSARRGKKGMVMTFTSKQRNDWADIQEWFYKEYRHASKYSRAMATRLVMGQRVVGDRRTVGHALAYEMAQAYIKAHRSFG